MNVSIISAASGDTEISQCSYDACKSKIACSSIPADEVERIKFALVIVDEAHNVYRKTPVRRDSGMGAHALSKKSAARDIIRSCMSKDITPNGDGQLVLLSDASQSSDECDFPNVADMKDNYLREVSRCTERIMLGAMAFQMGKDDRFLTTTSHSVPGKPLEPRFFVVNNDAERHRLYAQHILGVLKEISEKQFEKGFSLNDRVAVICPNTAFCRGVADAMSEIDTEKAMYTFVSASKACAKWATVVRVAIPHGLF